MVNEVVYHMVNRGNKRRVAPPSRVKYEASHPTVSVRVNRALYDELKARREAGQSMADILKVGLEKSQAVAGDAYDKGFKDGHRDGHKDGYQAAKGRFEVTYLCSRCRRRHMSITSHEEKEAAANMMYEADWHHTRCRLR